jgi:hypothetical protein
MKKIDCQNYLTVCNNKVLYSFCLTAKVLAEFYPDHKLRL